MTRFEALDKWMENMLNKLKNGPENLITLGWAIINSQLIEQRDKNIITEKEYDILHNKGLKELNFEI